MNEDQVALLLTACGALIATFTVMKLVTAGFEYILDLRARILRWRHQRSYILIPSIEEIARYSGKIPDHHKPTWREVQQDHSASQMHEKRQRKRRRIVILGGAFAALYTLLALRLLEIMS